MRPSFRFPALLAPVALAALLAGCASGGSSGRSAADLTNPFLGPESSSWLIGPIARMATPDEVKEYLGLTDDAQAQAFIDKFWAKRSAGKGNPLRETFDERTAEADRLYSEAGYRGRRTDRGTLYVLYGPPAKADFDAVPNGPLVEVWTYAPTTPAGLDGRKPNGLYRFIKKGDLTVIYVPGQDPRLRHPMSSSPL